MILELRTLLGKTLHRISTEVGEKVDDLDGRLIKRKLKYAVIPELDAWRVPLGLELMAVKSGQSHLSGFTDDEIESILRYVCVN